MVLSLAVIQQNLENMMAIIDETENLTPEIIDKFLHLKEKREEKCDGWIAYWDRAKHYVAEIKERRDRFQKAYKAAQSIEKQIKERIKYHIENDKTGLAFKGKELGTLYLHKNPKAVAHIVPTEDTTVYGIIKDPFYLNVCKNYLKEISFKVLDKQKLKADLECGIELTFATIEQKKHVRIKGG